MEKEAFIHTILNCTNSISKVTPNDELLKKIETRINENYISMKTLWLVAASIIVLCTINILFVTETSKYAKKEHINFENVVYKNNQIYQ